MRCAEYSITACPCSNLRCPLSTVTEDQLQLVQFTFSSVRIAIWIVKNFSRVRQTVANAGTAMVLWSFYKTLITDPGRIPSTRFTPAHQTNSRAHERWHTGTEEWRTQPPANLIHERKRDGKFACFSNSAATKS